MSLNEVSHDKMFKELKCPYTKKPITVRVVAAGTDMPRFFSPDAYDPTSPVSSSQGLVKALSTRDGIIGIASAERALICPYTGKTMAIRKLGNLFFAEGGFSPSTPNKDRIAFARALHMRDGVVPDTAPQAKTRITAAAIEEAEVRPPITPPLRESSLEFAEKAIIDSGGYKPPVTVQVAQVFPNHKKKRR